MESYLDGAVGAEEMAYVTAHIEEYLSSGTSSRSDEELEAVMLLTSMGDFTHFKATMLTVKNEKLSEMVATGAGDTKAILMTDIFERLAGMGDTWVAVLDKPGTKVWPESCRPECIR